MRESIIQTQIKKHLEAEGWMVIKLIQTSCNGIPDLMCLRAGEAMFLEIKQPGKKPNDLQAYRIDKLNKQGFFAFYVTSVEECKKILPTLLKKVN
jgi:Holliday junction resolvase